MLEEDGTSAPSSKVRKFKEEEDSCTRGALTAAVRARFVGVEGLTSSSQVSIDVSNQRIMRAAK
jgi:hypothetical protein